MGISTQNEGTNLGGVGGCSPRKFGNFWAYQVSSEAISGHTIALNQEHSHYAGFVRGVKSLHFSRQTRVQWDQGSVRDFVIITVSTRSRSTAALSASIICKRACSWWGMASSYWGTCPSVPQIGYATAQETLIFAGHCRSYNDTTKDTVAGAIQFFEFALLTFYGFWNLDFFQYFIPSFCISSDMSTLHTLVLEYIVAVYPLLLTLVIYVCVEMYDSRVRVVVCVWRPFHVCFTRFRRR